MNTTEKHIRFIIQEEIHSFLSEQLPKSAIKSHVKKLSQKAQHDSSAKSSIQSAIRSITSHTGIKKDLEKIMDNPVSSATFITSLMTQLGLDPESYVNILTSLSEVKKRDVGIILENCFKVLKEYNCQQDAK
tara:strand:+ start:3709 stop:4104 length:396 start_codon:yes stop_codon:yes gene_type:complete